MDDELAEISEEFILGKNRKWLKTQASQQEIQEDGLIKKRAGVETKSILAKLKAGDSSAIEWVKENLSVNLVVIFIIQLFIPPKTL